MEFVVPVQSMKCITISSQGTYVDSSYMYILLSLLVFLVSDPNTRIGRFSWLVFAALMIETMIELKFGWEILTIVPPLPAVIGWTSFIVLVVAWATWKFTYPLKEIPIIRSFFGGKKKVNWTVWHCFQRSIIFEQHSLWEYYFIYARTPTKLILFVGYHTHYNYCYAELFFFYAVAIAELFNDITK